MAGDRELVLILATDAPFLRRDGRVLSHRHTSARLGVPRSLRDHLAGAELAYQRETPGQALGAIGLEQHPPQTFIESDRRIAGRVDAARDAPVDLAERDLVGDQDGRLQAGVACLLHVVGGGGGGESAPEHRLAREVEVASMLEHSPGHHLAGALALKAKPRDQAIQGGGQHVLVRRPRVRSIGSGKRDPVAAHDRRQSPSPCPSGGNLLNISLPLWGRAGWGFSPSP